MFSEIRGLPPTKATKPPASAPPPPPSSVIKPSKWPFYQRSISPHMQGLPISVTVKRESLQWPTRASLIPDTPPSPTSSPATLPPAQGTTVIVLAALVPLLELLPLPGTFVLRPLGIHLAYSLTAPPQSYSNLTSPSRCMLIILFNTANCSYHRALPFLFPHSIYLILIY